MGFQISLPFGKMANPASSGFGCQDHIGSAFLLRPTGYSPRKAQSFRSRPTPKLLRCDGVGTSRIVKPSQTLMSFHPLDLCLLKWCEKVAVHHTTFHPKAVSLFRNVVAIVSEFPSIGPYALMSHIDLKRNLSLVESHASSARRRCSRYTRAL